ncbi:hypothetical protein AAGW05_00205 [Arthrobacter sp. LAPM80]|uniref:AMP-binding enzyme n=1 Tax=Arthrobacter sp. LAPM80 TaxID=3141788 RepID=UPI00398A99C7
MQFFEFFWSIIIAFLFLAYLILLFQSVADLFRDEKLFGWTKAVVVRAPGTTVSEADIIALCRDRLAHFRCPTAVDFVDELLRHATGKILKGDLREPYWRGHDRKI